MKYAIRLDNEIIWTCNGEEELFNSEHEAQQALIAEMAACERAHQAGYMDDSGDFDNYRIVEVESC